MQSILLLLLFTPLLLCISAIENAHHPSAKRVATAADEIYALLQQKNSIDVSWGSRGDLMGLMVRLPFHDSATFRPNNSINDISLPIGGADGCIDLDSPENKGLQEAIDILDPILQKVNSESNNDEGGMLSRADLWALAGNIMIEEAGGPSLEYRIGRVDTSDCKGQGTRHVSSESKGSKEVERVFVDELGFTHREVVALIGAHVLGKATKEHSGYEGPWVRQNDRFNNGYFLTMIHEPWHVQTEVVEPFGNRTTWHRFESMQFQREIMLQTDVDLAFDTSGGFCTRIGGNFIKGMSCPNATHGFSSHVRDFAMDEEAFLDEFTVAWAKLMSMTPEELECITPDCNTPPESWTLQEEATTELPATSGGERRLGKWWLALLEYTLSELQREAS